MQLWSTTSSWVWATIRTRTIQWCKNLKKTPHIGGFFIDYFIWKGPIQLENTMHLPHLYCIRCHWSLLLDIFDCANHLFLSWILLAIDCVHRRYYKWAETFVYQKTITLVRLWSNIYRKFLQHCQELFERQRVKCLPNLQVDLIIWKFMFFVEWSVVSTRFISSCCW